MSNAMWQNNTVQFSRLLAEIEATQSLDLAALAESMDLTQEQLKELFGRAEQSWEQAKAGEEPLVPVNLNIFDEDGNVVDGTSMELSLSEISDVVDHAAQLILVRRAGGDIESVLDELDEALSAADVI